MPSIQDVADQINAKLDQINQNTADTVTVGNDIHNEVTETNSRLGLIDAHLQAGVVELANGLFAIWELQKVTNSILEHQTDQNNTMICLLENANELLCDMSRKMTRQLDISEQSLNSLQRMEGIAERAEPAAAADYDRHAEIQSQIEACCPPDEPELERCPEACKVPEEQPYEPEGQDWEPPRQPDPIG